MPSTTTHQATRPRTRRASLTGQLRSGLRRRRRPSAFAEGAVHFHQGPQGLPVVCDDPGCRSPHLDV